MRAAIYLQQDLDSSNVRLHDTCFRLYFEHFLYGYTNGRCTISCFYRGGVIGIIILRPRVRAGTAVLGPIE